MAALVVYLDTSVGGRDGELGQRTQSYGIRINDYLEKGVSHCVCKAQRNTICSSTKLSKRAKLLVGENQGQVSIGIVADNLGSKVLTEEQYRKFLDSQIPRTNRRRSNSKEMLPNSTRSTNKSSLKALCGMNTVRKCSRTATPWAQSKPLSAGELVRLVVRDVDDLIVDRVRSFNPTKLEWCRIHREAPPGVSLFLPPKLWPTIKPDQCDSAEHRSPPDSILNENNNYIPMGRPVIDAEVLGGFCECCNVAYRETLSVHCQSKLHTSFVNDESNFVDFDHFCWSIRRGEVPILVEEEMASALKTPKLSISASLLPFEIVNSKQNEPRAIETVSQQSRIWNGPAVINAPKKITPQQQDPHPECCLLVPFHSDQIWFNEYEEQRPTEGKHVGKRVVKSCRVEETINGVVENADVSSGRVIYRVVYGDGDMEEMSSEELLPLIDRAESVGTSLDCSVTFETARSLKQRKIGLVNGDTISKDKGNT